MKNWFACTITFNKEDDRGNVKKVAETYLIDALSYTEAEARAYKELGSIHKDFVISALGKSNLTDVFDYGDSDTWYKVKVTYTIMDEKSEKERKIANYMLVSAHNIKEAHERIEESLKTMLVPYRIVAINQYLLMDVFVYEKTKEKVEESQEVDN